MINKRYATSSINHTRNIMLMILTSPPGVGGDVGVIIDIVDDIDVCAGVGTDVGAGVGTGDGAGV